MSSLSDYTELEILDHIFGGAAYTSPTNVYLALYTVAPTDSGGGTEVSGNGYARQQMSFGAAASGSITTDTAESFTASGSSTRAPFTVTQVDSPS